MKKIFLILVLSMFSGFVFSGEITSDRAIKEFFKENSDLRLADDAVTAYKSILNDLTLKVVQKATELAKAENRKTILKRDIEKASDEVFCRAPMTIPELMEKIKLLSIIDIAELSKQVKAYGDELLSQRSSK